MAFNRIITYIQVVALLSGNVLVLINVGVTIRRARLIFGWVTSGWEKPYQ